MFGARRARKECALLPLWILLLIILTHPERGPGFRSVRCPSFRSQNMCVTTTLFCSLLANFRSHNDFTCTTRLHLCADGFIRFQCRSRLSHNGCSNKLMGRRCAAGSVAASHVDLAPPRKHQQHCAASELGGFESGCVDGHMAGTKPSFAALVEAVAPQQED